MLSKDFKYQTNMSGIKKRISAKFKATKHYLNRNGFSASEKGLLEDITNSEKE